MRAIDVMALPSHREPFGLVYVEAALCERPTVACDAGGAPEIVSHGETGLLIPPRNTTSISKAILELLTNKRTAAEMGRRGRQRCLDLFSWNQYVRDLRELYERVINDSVRNRSGGVA